MALKTRGTLVGTREIIQLKAQFRDGYGNLADLSSIPRIQIIQPNSALYMDYSSVGVYQISTGTYALDFTTPLNGPVGVWCDNWQGIMGTPGYLIRGSFNFIVTNTNLGAPNIDGYVHIGDEPIFDLSQTAIININKLIKLLKHRLGSSGRRQTKDGYGNIVYENCDIFSNEELHMFLCAALTEFNLIPHFTSFTFEEQIVVDYFGEIIVEGAYIMALLSKALMEKGKEFNISDNGISFTPPAVADLLNSQASSLLGPYREKLKLIKHQFKSILGLGTLRITAVAPQYMRLRHRRENQFI